MITGTQIKSTFIMFWLGSLVVLGVNQDAKQDAWIPILLSFIMFLPLIWLYSRLVHLYPGLNLFEMLLQIFGKVFGRIMAILFILFAIHLGSMIMRIFAEFIQILSMPETPQILTIALLSLTCIFCVSNGPENIGRISKFTWPIMAAAVLVTLIISFKDMDFNNLMPVMTTDFKTLIGGGLVLCMFPLGEGVLCLSLFSAVSPKIKLFKILIEALALTVVILLLVNMRNILILGFPSSTMYYFPSDQAVSVISVGDFFTRMEVIIGLNLMLAGVIKVCVCLYAASLGLAKVMNIKNQKSLIVPCCLLMVTVAGLIYSSTQDMTAWIKIYPVYAIPFQALLPAITLIGAEIQNKIKNGGSSKSKNSENGNEPAS